MLKSPQRVAFSPPQDRNSETLQHEHVKFDWNYYLSVLIPVPLCQGGEKKKPYISLNLLIDAALH